MQSEVNSAESADISYLRMILGPCRTYIHRPRIFGSCQASSPRFTFGDGLERRRSGRTGWTSGPMRAYSSSKPKVYGSADSARRPATQVASAFIRLTLVTLNEVMLLKSGLNSLNSTFSPDAQPTIYPSHHPLHPSAKVSIPAEDLPKKQSDKKHARQSFDKCPSHITHTPLVS
jgi:hypothetical protein